MGILRRASERGKALPPKLERALKIQAGLMRPDGQPTDLNAFHINQRDEGIDLHGVSGALMATANMQMQTFVTQPDDTVEGFDGYNGDLTGDVAATLGANCGMSTGRNGIMAFAANQRDEVRDLHDVAGALGAQQGMKQQTFVAAAFSAGAGASAGSIGYGEELAPTLKGSASGNCMPSVLCLNDQGGSVMECSENVSGTLRAQEHGHQPLVYWFNRIFCCGLGYLLNCLPLHLSIGPCIDSGSVDVGMAQKLREKDKRHTGTIQMHGTGMPKLVWMYSFRYANREDLERNLPQSNKAENADMRGTYAVSGRGGIAHEPAVDKPRRRGGKQMKTYGEEDL